MNDWTNNKKINLERLKLISIEACEQSSRVNLPSFNNLISFSEMIKTMSYDKLIFCSLEKNTSAIDKINLSLLIILRKLILKNAVNYNYISISWTKLYRQTIMSQKKLDL